MFVRDLASRNGTKVRGEVLRGEEKLVTAGDTILVSASNAQLTLDKKPNPIPGVTDPSP